MVSKSFCKYKAFLLDLPFRKCKKNALFLPNPIDRHPYFIDQSPISGKRLGVVVCGCFDSRRDVAVGGMKHNGIGFSSADAMIFYWCVGIARTHI